MWLRSNDRGRLIVAALIAGCGGGEGNGLTSRAITTEEIEPLCLADCQRDIECGGFDDLPGCTSECIEDFVLWARGDAVETFLECTALQVCAASEDPCFALVEPLAIHEDWEAACRENLGACPDIDPERLCEVSPSPISVSIGLIRFIAPEIMPSLIACLDGSSCNTQVDCLEAALEANRINL